MQSITPDQFPMLLIILAVAILSLILSTIGFSSYFTTRDKRIIFVATAFGVFFLKNFLVVISLLYDIFPHGDLEFVEALFDLVTLIFLIVPVIKKDW